MGASTGDRIATILRAAEPGLAYFRVDAERNVVEVSPGMEALTGFRAHEVMGRSCLTLHRCEECLRGCGVFEHGEVASKRLRLFRAGGSAIEVLKSGRVVRDSSGAVAGAIEVVRPLTSVRRCRDTDVAEAERIRQALEEARYRRAEAAGRLGMSRTTLWRKMRAYGL